MSSLTKKPFKREIELDFIRGIAILMVVDFHSHHTTLLYPFLLLGWYNFGWAGVNIFFILSGFLVGGLLVKEWKVRGRIDSKQFLIRRGFKIWPQYYVFLLIMLFTVHRSMHFLWGNFLNIQNYVGGIGHTWSLAVEEHAYLILVFILAIAARRRTRMRNLFLLLAILSACVVALAFILEFHRHDIFSTTHTRIDGIFYGVMLAIVYHYAPETFVRLQRYVWLWIAIVLAALAYFRFKSYAFWGERALTLEFANAMGIAVMMLLYRHREGKKHSMLYRFIAWIGLYSYGIYLWHIFVISLVNSWERHLPHWALSIWQWAAGPVFGILLGIFFSKVIEFPTLRLRDRLFPRRVDSAVGTPAKIEEEAMVASHGQHA